MEYVTHLFELVLWLVIAITGITVWVVARAVARGYALLEVLDIYGGGVLNALWDPQDPSRVLKFIDRNSRSLMPPKVKLILASPAVLTILALIRGGWLLFLLLSGAESQAVVGVLLLVCLLTVGYVDLLWNVGKWIRQQCWNLLFRVVSVMLTPRYEEDM